jgi:hypothetical protein
MISIDYLLFEFIYLRVRRYKLEKIQKFIKLLDDEIKILYNCLFNRWVKK